MTCQTTSAVPAISSERAGSTAFLSLSGPWLLAHAAEAEVLVQTVHLGRPTIVDIDLTGVSELDTAGAWLIHRLRGRCEFKGARVQINGLKPRFRTLIDEVEAHHPPPWTARRRRISLLWIVEATGRQMVEVGKDAVAVLHILGTLGVVIANTILHPSRLRLVSIAHQFDRVGIGAVPIVMLMSFLIGAIITQQGGFYLRQFGADRYSVDLVGVLVLREIGVLLTAIMVAGRSGSAFTAELGSMKMREEIDALHVIGLRVGEVLVLPRILALMLALPMLSFFADVASLFGGAMVAWSYLGIQPQNFLQYLRAAIDFQTLMIGLVKAPFMALIIGLVACVEGLKVRGSSESLGLHTTLSVVKAIFMVIVTDGLFAMFFAGIGI
ncbi:phospholipid/cholesterol/gamma-HCH transport system permease protein [Breoghania corrubedonensis]|uniref:Phospholipid/cholesterol/gamma-HCH transport system permease protein n=1 Tax=Breoghania corrubedonensis TaxID=665038 RepID=A0A2T5V4M3_9HYPH|nr:ABC transporter permease [Breoghania corrubedonensis]PTW58715.1 phospholipid/cholesterol/gamma-HCH transport system permease protein [Breoghania corrubedonensis]